MIDRPHIRPESSMTRDLLCALALIVAFLVIFGIPVVHDAAWGEPVGCGECR